MRPSKASVPILGKVQKSKNVADGTFDIEARMLGGLTSKTRPIGSSCLVWECMQEAKHGTTCLMAELFAGAPFICGSFLVFIALIVGLCIHPDEVRQSEASGALQDPLLGELTVPANHPSAHYINALQTQAISD